MIGAARRWAVTSRCKLIPGLLALAAMCAATSASASTCRPLPVDRRADPARLTVAQAFANEAVAQGADAVIVMLGGRLVVSRGAVAEPMLTASVRKPIMGALFGIALAEGALSVTDPIGRFSIGEELTEAERGATVGDLLALRSGIYLPAADESEATRAKRPARGSHIPGSFFYYSNWDANVLAEIYRRATGRDFFNAFATRIAKPLCMQDFDLYRDGTYTFDPTAPRYPSYGFKLSARDLARFGQLYLDRGRWQGRQILPADWITQSTTPRSSAGWGGPMDSFGYLWWMPPLPYPATMPTALKGSFTANGAGGNKLTVIPALGAVLVVRTRTPPGPKPGKAFISNEAWSRLLIDFATAMSPPPVTR